MGITKSAIRKLEKRLFSNETTYIAILSSSENEAAALKQEAKKQGKFTFEIPFEVAEKNGIKLWNLVDLREA